MKQPAPKHELEAVQAQAAFPTFMTKIVDDALTEIAQTHTGRWSR